MADSEDALVRQYKRYGTMKAQAHADVQAAIASGDYEAECDASDRLLACEQGLEKLNDYANQILQQQRHVPSNRYGLSPDEQEIAEKSFSGSNFGMTKDQMHQEYATQKNKLHHLRRTGQYRHTTDATG